MSMHVHNRKKNNNLLRRRGRSGGKNYQNNNNNHCPRKNYWGEIKKEKISFYI